MSRSLRKGPFVDPNILKRVESAQRTGSREPIKTWARACTIIPEFVGVTFMVHNGKNFIKVYCTEDMVGHKLGEFSATRVFRGHTNKKEAAKAAPGAPAAAAKPGGK
jgi:small subunit ribosomal protein S19